MKGGGAHGQVKRTRMNVDEPNTDSPEKDVVMICNDVVLYDIFVSLYILVFLLLKWGYDDCHLQEPQAVKLAVAQDCSESFAKAREEALKEMSATHPEFQQILYKPPGHWAGKRCWIDSSFFGVMTTRQASECKDAVGFGSAEYAAIPVLADGYRLLPWTTPVSQANVVLTLVDRSDKPISKPIATLGSSLLVRCG